MAPQTLVRAHRRDLAALTTLAERDLSIAFARFTSPDATKVRDALAAILPGLTATYGAAAATLAADWYDEVRDAQAVKRRFRAIPAELPDAGRTESLAAWAVGPLFQAEPDRVTTLAKLAGGFQRVVANASRETITVSSIEDPSARGWQRVGGARPCDFCSLLLGRGGVYTQASVDFLAHDNDRCGAEPVFD